MPGVVPDTMARLPASLREALGPVGVRDVRFALALATAIPIGVSVWAVIAPGARAARWLLLAIWTTLLVNAAWHLAAALVVFRGYAPGVVTGLAVNLPLAVLVLRQAYQDAWLTTSGGRALLPAALVLHVAGTVGLLLLGRALAPRG